jgi:hypothetical protein
VTRAEHLRCILTRLAQVTGDIPKDIIKSRYWTMLDQIVKLEFLGVVMTVLQEECHHAK